MVSTQPYYEQEKLTREAMLKDPEFLSDAYQYLIDRTGKRITDPEERIDELMEIMRVSQVNEISAVKNLTHARSADDEGKALMGKMFLAYDKSEGATGFWHKMLDYGQGLVSSPTTVGATALAIPTLGGSLAIRGGAQAGVQATNIAVRQIIKAGLGKFVKQQAIRSAGRAAAVEAPLGALTMGTEAAARRETGREEFQDIDVLQETLLGGAIGGATAGILGGAAGAIAATGRGPGLRGFQGVKRLDDFYKSKEAKIAKGTKLRQEQIKNNPKDEELIDDITEKIFTRVQQDPLNPEVVASGQKIRRSIMPVFSRMGQKPRMAREGLVKEGDKVLDEPFRASLNPEVMKNASAAAIEIIRRNIKKQNSGISDEELFKQIKKKKITEILHNAIKLSEDITEVGDELTPINEMLKVMRDYGLSPQEFSHVYMAEVSDAARVLVQQRHSLDEWNKLLQGDKTQLKEIGTMYDNLAYIQEHQGKLISEGRMASELAVSKETLDSLKVFKELGKKYGPASLGRGTLSFIKNLDKSRLALMTIQPATTVRNTINGTARLGIYLLDNAFHGAMTLDPSRMMAGPKLLKSMLDPTEAQILKVIFSDEMPQSFAQLYRKAADIEQTVGKKSKMVQVGRWLNGANTFADNAFKRAVFMAELNARLGKETIYVNQAGVKANKRKNLIDAMSRGEFSEIVGMEKHVSEAMQEALLFTYQRGFKSKAQGGGAWEDIGHRFLNTFNRPGLSLLVPFPRFTANSLEFMYKHAPLLGLTDVVMPTQKGILAKSKVLGVRAAKAKEYKQLSVSEGKKLGFEGKNLGIENKKREAIVKSLTQTEDLARTALPKRMANQVTGLAMLYGAIQLRAHQGPTASWWEMYDEDTGEYKQAMAFYGPFAIYMLAADIIIKSSDFGKNLIIGPEGLKNQWENTAKQTLKSQLNIDRFGEFLKATAGPQFKAGMGGDFVRSFQTAAEEFDIATDALNPNDPNYQTQLDKTNNRFTEAVAGGLGNIAATFLVPLGAVRDVMAGFDPEEWQGMKATDYISPADRFIKKSLRALPINSDGEYFGIVSSEGLAKFVPFRGEGLPSQDIITPTKTTYEEPLQRRQGIERQFTGLGSPVYKNVLEQELEKLNLKAFKLFPRIPQSSQLTRRLRQYYQEKVTNDIIPYIRSEEYRLTPLKDKAPNLERFIKSTTSSPLTKTQDLLLIDRDKQIIRGDSAGQKETENKLNESLQIRFRSKDNQLRRQSIRAFQQKNNLRDPNFENNEDMIELFIYVDQISKARR